MSAVKLRKPPAYVAAAIAQSYRLDFKTGASLGPEETDPITSVVGKILYLGSEDARSEDARVPEVIVGQLEGWYMRRDRLNSLDSRYNFFDMCDEDHRLRDSEYLFLDMYAARPSLEDLIKGEA